MAEDLNPKVEEFKDAIKNGAWNDISAQVLGDKGNQKALSEAVRATNQIDGLPKGSFSKDEKGQMVIEFTRPGVTGWAHDKWSGKANIKF